MFTINLNNPDEFTRENVARLIGSVLDTVNWQLRVTKGGVAFLSDVVGNRQVDSCAFGLETWCAGNNYVGFQAQHDKQWVDEVYQKLKANWPVPSGKLIN